MSGGRCRRRIAIITPAPARSRHGNRVTALRWALLLRQLGLQPFVSTHWNGRAAQALLAVHAKKSAPSVAEFAAAHPDRGIGVLLAGTDLYPEFRPDDEMRRCLEQARLLIALQPNARDVLPESLRAKVRVCVQSATAVVAQRLPRPPLHACVLAHLRPVKDPLLVFDAAPMVPDTTALRIVVAGRAMTPELGERATARRSERCEWIGELPHRQARTLLAQSHACIVPSLGEGGANVVSEAIAAGTPVLATDIPGNTALLGPDWPALFPAGDARALADLLERVANDAAFYDELGQRTARLQSMVAPDRERRALAAIAGELGATDITERA